MAKTALDTLKSWFETGDRPTQTQFWNWLDSFVHKDDTIAQSQITGLSTSLSTLAPQAAVDALKAITVTTTGSTVAQNIPAGTIIHKVRVKSTAGITYNLGTTDGGTQIIAAQAILANVANIVTIDLDNETLTTIHFSGLSGTTNIKIYLQQ